MTDKLDQEPPIPQVPDLTSEKIIPEDLMKWLRGATPDTPAELEKMKDSAVEKVNWFILFMIVKQVPRVSRMIEFITAAEDKLMDVEDLRKGNYNKAKMIAQHKEANKNMLELLDFARKFILQNKAELTGKGSNADEVALLLRQIEPGRLQEAKRVLQDMIRQESGSKGNKDE